MNLSSEEIFEKVFTSAHKYGESNPQQFEQLYSMISKSNPDNIFWGLFQVFEKTDHYPSLELSGKLLFSLKPIVKIINVKELIERSIKNWNKSIEQLPKYLAHNCGSDKMVAYLHELLSKNNDAEIQSKLETWLWWLGQ